ncbi:hypothetical protein [Paraburkholderia sp. CNPSo 3272]|nr:hypothetical protein [Paraburkholderia sp. CNPSo 3272]
MKYSDNDTEITIDATVRDDQVRML